MVQPFFDQPTTFDLIFFQLLKNPLYTFVCLEVNDTKEKFLETAMAKIRYWLLVISEKERKTWDRKCWQSYISVVVFPSSYVYCALVVQSWFESPFHKAIKLANQINITLSKVNKS